MVRAPFQLQQIEIDTREGQASGSNWFLCAFRSWRRRVYSQYPKTRTLTSFAYALGQGQYIGAMMRHGDRESWRRA